MATRSIVTSQPDVACEVCERRLLRGEQHDVFLAAGRRRIVCELCAPRAVHEGWRREADSDSLGLAPMRPRRGRNLFERLRQVARPAGEGPPSAEVEELEYLPPAPYEPPAERLPEQVPQPFDFLDDLDPAVAGGLERDLSQAQLTERAAARSPAGTPTPPERALEMFNASEFPRRIAGIARSLGAPAVHARVEEDAVGDLVAIIVAWELCWYRYDVDLYESPPTIKLAAQGTELEELPRGDRVANTHADELGLLSAP